jgi:Siphovirus Gp157
MNLYEIPVEFSELESALVESAGELSPELEQRFDAFLRAGKDKIEAGAMVVRGFEIEAEVCRLEAKRLLDRSAALENNAGRLRKLVLCALDSAFAGKVKTSLFTIWGQTSAPCISFDLTPGHRTSNPARGLRPRHSLSGNGLYQADAKAG